MKALTTLLGLGLVSALTAQSPLTTLFAGPNGLLGGGVVFINMTVNVPAITINRIDVNSNAAAGTQGRVRVWQTLPAFPLFSGSEGVAANWQLLAEGAVIAAGNDLPSTVCFELPFTLTSAMGPRGYAIEHIGIGPRYTNGTGSNQIYNNAEISLNAGAAGGSSPYADAGGANPFWTATNNPRVFNGSIHYTVGTSAPVCSFSNRFGAGCGGSFSSFFDLHLTPALASPALTGRQVTMIPNGSQYSVVCAPSPGLVPYGAHTPLGGWTTAIAGGVATDDGEVVVPLTTPFPYPGGTTPSLVVHNGGMISVASNQAYLDTQGGDDWAPSVTALLAAPNTAWYSWHDMDITTTGQVTFAEIGTQAVFTWVAVPSFGGGAPNLSTFQMTFDSSSGVVTMAWETVEAVGVPNPLYSGNPWLVGYSPGGANVRPETETDVAINQAFELSNTEVNNLLLTATPRPTFGSVIDYSVANMSGGFPYGLLFFSVANPSPNLPLALFGIGQAGCLLNHDLANQIGPFTFLAPGLVLSVDTNTVTPSMLGLDFWGQAAVVDLIAPSLLGSLTSSNALHQRVETL
jgi:hypothetical protein